MTLLIKIILISGIAKWKHIEELYNIQKNTMNFVYAPALTESHLNPNVKQQMRVHLAAQVLSHSVAAGLFAKVTSSEWGLIILINIAVIAQCYPVLSSSSVVQILGVVVVARSVVQILEM